MNELTLADLQAQEWQRRAAHYRLVRSMQTERQPVWLAVIQSMTGLLRRETSRQPFNPVRVGGEFVL